MSAGSILVIRGGAMGDFIVTLPVLNALRRSFRSARLEVVGAPAFTALAVADELVDGARPIESRELASFFARHGTLDPDWSHYFATFDIIFSYLYDPDGFFQANVRSVTKAQFIQGPHRPDELMARHVTNQLLIPLEQLAIFDANAQPRLRSWEASPMAPSRRWELAVHPGSGSEGKTWPEDRWTELLTDLAETTDLRFLLVGGEAETERLQRLAARLPEDRREVWSQRPLPALAQRLSRSQAFIGHDSGPSHLAAAIGLRGLAVWGSTAASVWRPRSPRFELLQGGPDLRLLPVPTVRETVLQWLKRCGMQDPKAPAPQSRPLSV